MLELPDPHSLTKLLGVLRLLLEMLQTQNEVSSNVPWESNSFRPFEDFSVFLFKAFQLKQNHEWSLWAQGSDDEKEP